MRRLKNEFKMLVTMLKKSHSRMMSKILAFFSLFGSLGTLLCCALPVTLVSLGMGASFASLTSSFPQINCLTQRKDALFIITAILLGFSFMVMKRSQSLACPIDTDQKAVCQVSKKVSTKLFWATVIIYFVGVIFSYILPYLLY